MRDQSCPVVKRVSGHSDRPQRRRYQARAPGAGALTQMCICVLGWNLVYVEKSACLQDTKAAPDPLPFHVAVMLCRARRGPRDDGGSPRVTPSPHDPLWDPSAPGLAPRISLSWVGSAWGM